MARVYGTFGQGKTDQSPHEAYYFYYHVNELHGIRYKDWKMYYPHRYRSMNGREGGKNGFPANYEYLTFDQIELYNLRNDISETRNVAMKHPEIVEKIQLLGDGIRNELGDALTKTEGTGNRLPGIISD